MRDSLVVNPIAVNHAIENCQSVGINLILIILEMRKLSNLRQEKDEVNQL